MADGNPNSGPELLIGYRIEGTARKKEFIMRRTLIMMLIVLFGWSGARSQPNRVKNIQLYVAPGFQFSQIDTICIAHPIDLRTDRAEWIYLSGDDPAPNVTYCPAYGSCGPIIDSEKHSYSIQSRLASDFNKRGYDTVNCKPVNATLDDLKAPNESWIRKLDFGESRWLFLLAIEDANGTYNVKSSSVTLGLMTGGWTNANRGRGSATVSGYLFDKQSASLVWSSKEVCNQCIRFGYKDMGKGSNGAASDFMERQEALLWAISGSFGLLDKFEKRKKHHGN
jgi:hypothetical protein